MALNKEAAIKEKIRLALEGLKRREILRAVIVEDFSKQIMERDYPAFPVAILQTASIENDAITNTQNFRIYTFDVVVLCKGEDVQNATTVEELRAAIMDEFDNQVTLGGVADGGVMPTSSPIEAVTLVGAKSYIAFTVSIQARAIKDLTFSS